MDILGIGPLELFFILLIALIVLGPNDMVKAGRTIGQFLRKIVTSQDWRTIQQASRDIRYLPNRLMREAGIEDIEGDIKKELPEAESLRKQIGVDELREEMKSWQEDMSDWTTPPSTDAGEKPPPEPEGALSEEEAPASEQTPPSQSHQEAEADAPEQPPSSQSEPQTNPKPNNKTETTPDTDKLEESENN